MKPKYDNWTIWASVKRERGTKIAKEEPELGGTKIASLGR